MILANKNVLSKGKGDKLIAYWKGSKYLLCTFLLLFFLSESALAQSYWKRSSERARRAVVDESKEPTHQYFRLDKAAFGRAIGVATAQGSASRPNSTTIQIPDADGMLVSYRVSATQVLSEAVAKANPTIRTFAGQAVDNPSKQISLVWSDYGLSGTMVEDFKYSFIDAEDKNGEFYKVYHRKDSKGDIVGCSTPQKTRLATDEEIMSSASMAHQRPTYQTRKRVYNVRLAIACTSAFTEAAGGKAQALAQVVNTVNRISMVYGAQMSVKFELVSGDQMIYDNAATDPTRDFKYGRDWDYPTEESARLQALFDSTLGNTTYDVGHLFHRGPNQGNAGEVGAITWDDWKGRAFSFYSFTGDKDRFDIDNVAHEIGHQLGARHTLSYRSEKDSDPYYSNTSQMEPGSASTIMGYAGITTFNVQSHSDPYFHHRTIWEITRLIHSTGKINYTDSDNSRPTFNDADFKDYTIPKGTAYLLEGVATDTAGDNLLYTWEQSDDYKGNYDSQYNWTPAYRFSPENTTGALARSLTPSNISYRYIPRLERIIAGTLTQTISGNAVTEAWETVPMVERQMHWSFVVTDRPFAANQTGNTAYKTITVTVADTAGPFVVTSHENETIWRVGQPTNVTWDVANTNVAPVSTDRVDILFSADGGQTFPYTLASGVPNNGSALVTPTEEMRTNQGRIMIKANGNIFLAVNKGVIHILNEKENIGLPDGALLISNAFTPNGDGINDTYVIARAENFPNNTLQVYNTLGQLVYEAYGYKNQWDGKRSNGELVARGSYLVIFSTDGSDEKKQKVWIYINY